VARITFVGHATILVEDSGSRLVTDPLLRNRVAHLRRIAPLPDLPGLTEPDAVLISHAHHDHLDVPSLERLRRSCRVLAPRGCGRFVRRAGLRQVTEISAGDRVSIASFEVLATPAEHDGRRLPLGQRLGAVGYDIRGSRRLYFAGDTDLFEGMRDLAGGLDVALLPVWGWGRRLPAGHLDPERAARAAALLAPGIAVPIHWGTLAAPGVGWRADPAAPARAFERAVARLAPDVEVRVLGPGESCSV
jgi:L-ascorbate metabolism protein UlaG (beta-lactamase superfamily)